MARGQFASFRVTVCGIEELAAQCQTGITHILSLLDPEMPEPRVFGRFARHQRLELRFHDAIEPAPGLVPPATEHIRRLLAFGREAMSAGPDAHLLIHCHGGLSRSTAAAALCFAQAYPSRSACDALGEIERLRPRAWPNLRMLELGDELLGRQGEFIAAAGALYRRMLDARPHLTEHLSRQGRGRELILAERWR